MSGPEEGVQHSRDIDEPEDPLPDGAELAFADAGQELGGRFNSRPKGQDAKLPLQMLRTVRKWLES